MLVLAIALAAVFDALREEAQQWLAGHVADAQLAEPLVVSEADATVATQVIRGLLDHVGDEGVTLTSAGYLPPASVNTLMTELHTDRRWIRPMKRAIVGR